jgi:hypothetical protein
MKDYNWNHRKLNRSIAIENRAVGVADAACHAQSIMSEQATGSAGRGLRPGLFG